MSLNVEQRLSAMEGAWKEAESGGAFVMPPDNDYQALVTRFDFDESQKTGHLQLVTELQITAGEHASRTLKTWHDLEDEERLGYAKTHLANIGLEELEPLSTLRMRLNDVVDTPVEIRIKRKRVGGQEYANVYVNRALGPPQTPGNGKAPDEDIPF